MKANNFQIKFNAFKNAMNRVIVPVSVIGLIGGFYFGSIFGIFLAIILLVLALIANCIWFVSSETAGVMRVFAKIEPRSYEAGWHGRVPLISDVALMNIQPQTRQFSDLKNSVSRNKITIDGTFCYTINKRYAHLVLQLLGENFYDEHLYQWMDAIFDSVVSQLSYPHFQATKQEVEEWCSKIIAGRIARECSSRTKNEVPAGIGFNSTFCELVPLMKNVEDPENPGTFIDVPILKSVPVDEDRTEMVPEFVLSETVEFLEGVELFENISIKINKVTFEKTYEEARSQVAIAKAKVAEEEEKRRRTLITLDTNTEIIRKKAEAEAEAIRLKGASENEIREKLGVILRDHPELIQEVLAKNFPKVFGGNGATPMIDLGSMLK